MKLGTISAIVVILLLPFIYLGLQYYYSLDGESLTFRGHAVATIDADAGTITLPTVKQDEEGATLKASFSPRTLNALAGAEPFMGRNLEIEVDNVDPSLKDCTADGTAPAKARFDVQVSCATALYKSGKAPAGKALLVDEATGLVAHIGGDNVPSRVIYNGWVASYVMPASTQTDVKRQGCLAHVMLDALFGIKQQPPLTCAPK